jgi:hypothetical protein
VKVISKFDFKEVSIFIAGDYYQVLFHDGLDTEDEPYFMIQAQFEFPDDRECYFESHREELIGHNKPILASLSKNVLSIYYGQRPTRNVEVRFVATDDEYHRLASTLAEMIPEITIETTK